MVFISFFIFGGNFILIDADEKQQEVVKWLEAAQKCTLEENACDGIL